MSGLAAAIEKVLEATERGYTIYADHLDNFQDGRRSGYLNPAYEDTKGSFSIYERGGKWRHVDYGNRDYFGDAVDFFSQVNTCTTVEAVRQIASRYGVDVDTLLTSDIQEKAPRKMRRSKVAKCLNYAPAQPAHHPASVLIEMDQPTTLTEHMFSTWGRAGRAACALYHVGRCWPEDFQTSALIYADAFGRICTIKRTKYRSSNGTITKKGTDGRAMLINFDWPEALTRIGGAKYRPAFGEHLLPVKGRRRHVVLVEAEDSAITAAASGVWPGAVFLAMSGQGLNNDTLHLLRRHKVQWVPDHDATEAARTMAARWQKFAGVSVEVVPLDSLCDMVAFSDRNGERAASKADLRDVLEDMKARGVV